MCFECVTKSGSSARDNREVAQVRMLDVRLQVEVTEQNMDKHPFGIHHSISTLYADPMMNSVELCISYGKLPREA